MLRRFMGRWTAAFAGGSLKQFAAAAALAMAAFGIANRAAAGPTFTGQFGAGGTWNVYELIGTSWTFKDAVAFAPTRENPIAGNSAVGHVVTLTDIAENNFVHTQGGGGDLWIGLTDRVGVAPGASESRIGFFPRNEGWAWVTGEPFNFDDPESVDLGNWGENADGTGIEPNDAGNPASGEDAAHIRGDGEWNDHQSGFGQDEPVADFNSTPEGFQQFRFVIEWDTMLTTQPPGFPGSRPDPTPPPLPPIPRLYPTPLAPLPGPNGTASAFGVRDYTGNGASADTRDAINKVLAGTTFVDGTAARFDINDPQNGGNQGSVPAAQVPVPSNTAADDSNFQEVVKGTIQVPAGQGGAYTFNVRSDDGFAMRILSQPTGGSLTQHAFTAARSPAGRAIDEDGSLTFLAPTGDSNTQGVINLAPGTYDVEFIWFENGGGAFAEVSTAKGDFVSQSGTPQWILLGDGTSRPEVFWGTNQPAQLTGPVTVKNRARGTITNVSQIVSDFRANPNTPTAEDMFDDAILVDGDDICCGRPSAGVHPSLQHEFPNGGNDQFTTWTTGQFQVLDTDGAAGETLTFGLFADDNAGLHILGQSFTGVSDFDAPNPDVNVATLGNPEGMSDQWLIADYRTGNTNAFGLITLTEGVNYNFEAFQLEEGGDAGLEVWVAPGDRLATGFDPAAFFPLTTALLEGTVRLTANQGLPLVLGPGTGPSETALDGDFDGDGDVDTADYVVWRKTDNTQPGYDLWRANYGRTAGSGSALSAVPEPASALLVAVSVMLGGALVARRRAN
jgi:hypothetical protein